LQRVNDEFILIFTSYVAFADNTHTHTHTPAQSPHHACASSTCSLILRCRLRGSAARHACTTQREKPKKFWGKSGQPCGERQGITCGDCGCGGSITGSQPTLLATYHVPFRGEPAGFLK
jgi:hypothetical protein